MINSRAMPVPLTPSYRRVAGTAPQHASGRDFADPLGQDRPAERTQFAPHTHGTFGTTVWSIHPGNIAMFVSFFMWRGWPWLAGPMT